MRWAALVLTSWAVAATAAAGLVHAAPADAARPNILFCIADDWGWPHASAYGTPVVQTPTFDRLAREGVLFRHAYVSSPSCTPSRGAILTGQYHWRLDGAANLHSVFPDRFATYPEVLQRAGYFIGATGKDWGPGRPETSGRQLAGRRYRDIAQFLKQRPEGAPFCFWLGSSDPHRPYTKGAGEKSGMDLSEIELPACFPDHPTVRGDVADYFTEVQQFDRLVGAAVAALEKSGELDNTIIVMTGDHGMPFPRGKSNLYDTGTRVPLAIRWGAKADGGRTVDDFVSLTDLAPTFLDAAGLVSSPDEPEGGGSQSDKFIDAMTGRSLMPILTSEDSGRIVPERDRVLFGKERHVPAQEEPDMGGYPSRAIRTHEFLYIRNFRPDRWPNGTSDYENAAIPGTWYGDTDNGPTKTYMVQYRDKDAHHRRLYDLSFAKRPAEELYDLRRDPDQLQNVAGDPAHAGIKQKLADQLTAELKATGDPRITGGGERFDEFPYLGGGPKHPSWERNKK